ncbi:MAG: tRNA (N6-isopentenyl adenosine(37)-C2)-methylthiotransferase MiaB [Alphaproteobacteria bacterium]|nr:tRNA (N6-isopentenyl adenosine(37)-C2)-methylthiotransferase MiaB [Alphaproteobacteria bacterium]MDP6516438.1 tRNA (N6-isopentenyl adenosine(37)-C2)-methylthiotransferase MiaB [Alphaproteobacteria bacterium]
MTDPESAVPAPPPVAPKSLFIKTYGCQMNVYDSGRMADVLAPLGYRSVDRADRADMVILNTCHIRDKATEKVFSELGRLRSLQRRKRAAGGRMILAVAGCVGQAQGEAILARAPFVDIVLGPQTYHRLPEMVARASRAGGDRVLDTSFPAAPKFDRLPAPGCDQGVSAFLSVQEGCDKFCTFCVVPYTRGTEYSRPVPQILAEAEALIAAGAREITLLGQNVNAYHGAGPDGGASWSLATLIRRLAELGGLERIRYTTSHPGDLDDSLIEAHRDVAKLMPYLHLPVQSGSDRILGAMRRPYRAQDYRRLVARLRAARPDLALSSDFIVGFPGETEADFAATLDLVRDVGFAQAFSFKYSARPGTPAALLPGGVEEDAKSERLGTLQRLLASQREEFNRAMVGGETSVLLEKPGRHPGQLVGRSPYLQAVHINDGRGRIGDVVRARVIGCDTNSLSGEALAVAVGASRRDPARVGNGA